MPDSTLPSVEVTVDPRIFPLPIIQNALYCLSDCIDSRIQVQESGKVSLTLTALADDLTTAALERKLNAALLEASVNERAFQAAASIRDYLAQTAFSITTETQQTIEEFAASMGSTRTDEHAGAPAYHVDIPAPEEQGDLTTTGVQRTVDEENGRVILQFDGRKYLLPDALWAAHEMRDTCPCSIDVMPRGQLLVLLEPNSEEADLNALGERFEHWLDVARERSQ